MSTRYNGSNASDYPDTVTFFPPFSAIDLLNTDYSGTPAPQPGTTTVGVVSIAPDPATGINTAGLIGFDPLTGKALWTTTTGMQNNVLVPSSYGIFSNGTDTLGVAGDPVDGTTVLSSVNAQTGRDISYTSLSAPPDGSPAVLGMMGQTIAVTDGTTVRGLDTKNLSTVVWQHPANADATPALGQCVATADGYVRISDGAVAGFGSAALGGKIGYVVAANGSVFQWTSCPATPGGCLQQIDPDNGTSIWVKPVPANSAGDFTAVVAQRIVMLPCDGVCGYNLSDGRLLWNNSGTDVQGKAPYRTAGQFVLAYGEGGITAVQIKDGQNSHSFPWESHPAGMLPGQNIFYGADDQTLTAYDAATDLHALWTVPMPTAGLPVGPLSGTSGSIGQSSGHLFVAGSDGRVWVVQQPLP